jgi:hypothetical protein
MKGVKRNKERKEAGNKRKVKSKRKKAGRQEMTQFFLL